MKLRIKNTALTVKIISWLQIVGGILGLYSMTKIMLQTDAVNGPLLFILLFGLSLFIFSIYTGNTTLRSQDKKRGIILMLINQILQLFQWCMFGYSLSYSSGMNLLIGIKGALSFVFDWEIGSTFSMSINSSDEQFYLKINLIAILLIIVLISIYTELKNENKTAEAADPLLIQEANDDLTQLQGSPD